ncbi:MAG TPA: ABC transporter ATP-binding protein [Acidimicrobiia bacterium]|nr:ABC transporter ATP-binding protein [Acidimicrobiia bacterium]
MITALTVDRLRVTYPGPPPVRAVDDLSLAVAGGECLGILGESGSGKSTFGRSLLGLAGTATVAGAIHLGDVDLTALDEDGWRDIRWRRISMAMQSAASLNPVLRIGLQLAEPQQVHLDRRREEADARSAEVLDAVGLGDWALERYPRELSGGQRRLVLLALALVCDPEVLVLDEPTSGLDPATRNRVLEVLGRLRGEGGRALLVMSHDADALELLADRVAVMYRGWLAEIGPAGPVLEGARHPYSRALLNARPTLASVKDLRGIRGDPPNPTEVAPGCPFAGRCTQEIAGCRDGRPPLVPPTGEAGERLVACIRGGVVPVLVGRDLSKSYAVRRGLGRREQVAAVDRVSVEVTEGEVVGLVGASGAGKSTLSSMLVRLLEPDGGSVELEGLDLLAATGPELKAARRRMQLLFQDPFEALSARLTVGQAVREPLELQGLGDHEEQGHRVRATLRAARLPADDDFLARYTHELSGGQLQRVSLARALVLEPKVLVADEPVSMLDPSEQAKVLQLLKQLQVDRGMAMVLVSHDLASVLRIADRVLVMDRGRVVEEGTGSELLMNPRHPATRALLDAAGRDLLFEIGDMVRMEQ